MSIHFRKQTTLIVLMLLLLGFPGVLGQEGNEEGQAEPEVHFIKPQDGETLEQGRVGIVAEGTGFDICWFADFFYRPEDQQEDTLISRVINKHDTCVLATEWDTTDLPDGRYHLRVRLLGFKERDRWVESEILVQLGTPPTPPVIEPEGPPEAQPPEAQPPQGVGPKAAFRFEPLEPTTRDMIRFIDESVPAPGSKIIRWIWDFGDGSPLEYLPNPYHRYPEAPEARTYQVTLTVTDDLGRSDSASQLITVKPFVEIFAQRTLMAFPPLPSDGEPEGPDEILPGNLFQVTVKIELQIDVMAFSLSERLSRVDGQADPQKKLPSGWVVEKGEVDWEIPPTVAVDPDVGALEWIFRAVGRDLIPKGTEITVRYKLRVPLDPATNDYQFEGKVEYFKEGTGISRIDVPRSLLKVVKRLPLEMAIAHLKGKEGRTCKASFQAQDDCQVDPLFNPDHLITHDQYRLAKDFWQQGAPVPYAKGPNGEELVYVTPELLLKLLCYVQNKIPITKPCSEGVIPPSTVWAQRTIIAFPPLLEEKSSIPRVLPDNTFQVEVAIRVHERVLGISLNEDFNGNEGLPRGWDVVDWEPIPSDADLDIGFQKDTLEWIFAGAVPIGDEIRIRILYKVPSVGEAILGLYQIEGRVRALGVGISVAGDSWLRLADALPIKMAIAHLKGEGCSAASPGDCLVEPLFNKEHLITDDQYRLAENFWGYRNPDGEQVAIPHAFGPKGEKPAYVTPELLEELSCYRENGLPVTGPCSPAARKGASKPGPSPPDGLRGSWAIPYVIAHLSGDNCSADRPESCKVDFQDDDLIDERQLRIAQDFWQNEIAVPQAIGSQEEQPVYITLEIMLELICYYARQMPVTEPTCSPVDGQFLASASRTVWAFSPLPPETLPQVLPGYLLEVEIEIKVETEVFALGLDETPPIGWTITRQYGWIQPQPSSWGVLTGFKGATAEWVFPGPIPAGSVISITYLLKIPEQASVDASASIKGWVSDGRVRTQVAGGSSFKVVRGLPIKMVIAHITGEGCGADSPDRCVVNPKLDDFINDRQIDIAREFWLKDKPVPYAVDSRGRQPAYITKEVYLQLICYYTKKLPVTDPSCSET